MTSPTPQDDICRVDITDLDDKFVTNNADINENDKSTWEIFKEFSFNTTAHGFGRIASSGSRIIRLAWIFVTFATFTGNILHLRSLTRQYLDYGTTERVSIVDYQKPVWPAITICNSVPYSFADLLLSIQGTELNRISLNRHHIQSNFNHTLYSLRGESLEIVKRYLNTVPDEVISGNFDDVLHNFGDDIVSYVTSSLSGDWIAWNYNATRLGHHLNNLIPVCNFDKNICNYSQFRLYTSRGYLKCYTFATGQDVSESSRDHPFSPIIFLDSWLNGINNAYQIQLENYPHGDRVHRAIVEIHESGTLPNPESSGHNVPAGFSIEMGIKQHVHDKIPHPYSNCSQDKRLPEFPQYRYSQRGCHDVCRIMYVYESCNCLISGSSKPESMSDVEYCAYVSPEDANGTLFAFKFWCEKRAKENFNRDMCGSNGLPRCNEPCSYNSYEITHSSAPWPSMAFLKYYLRLLYEASSPYYDYYDVAYRTSYDENLTAFLTSNEQYNERILETFRRNFARLDVYFEDLSVIEHKEAKAMTLGDLFANIGGTLGLWIGISVITVIEFISLPFELLYKRLKKIHNRNNVVQIQPSSTAES